ncbi:hypothetical protein SAMN06265374_3498 [Roseibium denhamense]|uniref:Uncharacterized protein n=1 Tax=Roseibium denhamense TaxID=76305 RepID=A0ABY1PG25_9HYPH|nr:hypothetical protein SAMN06265374_3498 [Roseibium denhamense]
MSDNGNQIVYLNEKNPRQTNARQWEEVLAGDVSTWQDWEEGVLRVTRPLAGRRMPRDAISNFSAGRPACGELDVTACNSQILQLAAGHAGELINRTAVLNPVAVLLAHSVKHLLFLSNSGTLMRLFVDYVYNSAIELYEGPTLHVRHAFCATQHVLRKLYVSRIRSRAMPVA